MSHSELAAQKNRACYAHLTDMRQESCRIIFLDRTRGRVYNEKERLSYDFAHGTFLMEPPRPILHNCYQTFTLFI